MNLKKNRVILHDMCLRDGMHPKAQRFEIDEMVRIARGLDDAGVPLIEVGHGDGLGGASLNYGFPKYTDEEYLRAVSGVVKRARISVLLIPGIGTVDDLRLAVDCGARCVRVATHCTEADTGEQHVDWARKLGLDTVGFLMMSHMSPPEIILQQAKLFESYGATCVYVTDSAGSMLPDDVRQRVGLLRTELLPQTEIGFHGHHNLGMSIPNSLAAIEVGASRVDGSAAGLGAGAGNTPLEVMVAVCNRLQIQTGVDFYKICDVAEDLVVPIMDRPMRIDRDSLMLGYAGVYSTFLLFAKRAAKRYNVSARDLLVELGRRGTIAGQEDMIESVAMEMERRV